MTNQPRPTDDSRDRVIDEVARRMTSLEPPADLRARIMSRIEPRAEHTPRWWMSRLVPAAIGVAALAAVVIAVRMPRPATVPLAPAVAAPASSPIESASAGGATGAPDEMAAPAPAPAQRSSSRTSSMPRPSDDELAWLERAVPALTQPEALAVEGIQPPTLTIAHIEVKPLAAEPLSSATANGGGLR